MGYSTTFEGVITVTPPLTPEHALEFNDFCSTRHESADTPSIWCDWISAENGSVVRWNGSEKSYAMDKWLELLVRVFFEPNGYCLNGAMIAHGERSGDIWGLVVVDNDVECREARITID